MRAALGEGAYHLPAFSIASASSPGQCRLPERGQGMKELIPLSLQNQTGHLRPSDGYRRWRRGKVERK